MPPESVIQYTRVTGQSLFYRDANALTNKVLAIEEEEGLREALYSVKTLISSQRLSISTTRTDAKTGKFAVEDYTVNGPVVVFVSTTNPDALDDESKQRFMVLTIDESDEQTLQILRTHRTKNSHRWYQMSCDEQHICRLHHNMHRLLKPLTVTFPDELNINWPFGKLQYRREHQKFFSLIKAITILHQYQRKSGTIKRADGTKMEYVLATQKDVDLAVEIGRAVFVRNVDDVAPSGRRLLDFVLRMTVDKHAVRRIIENMHGKKDEIVTRNRLMIELAYGSGLRLNELALLNVEDVDFAGRCLHISGKGDKDPSYRLPKKRCC